VARQTKFASASTTAAKPSKRIDPLSLGSLPVLYAATLFVSAFLLFLVQPMIGKIMLPYLGGTPAVWNTCQLFFQAALLAGYLYSHGTSARLQPKPQVNLHYIVLAIPIVAMILLTLTLGAPIEIPETLVPQGESLFVSVVGTLFVLTIAIGLPFLVVATSAPLLQRWFASTGHPSAKDPYFLYAASNIGSFGALFLYPLLIERLIGVGGQKWVWAIGYGLLVVMIYLCGQVVLKSPDNSEEAPPKPTPPPETNGEAAASADQPAEAAASDEASAEADAIDRGTLSDAPITNWQRLRWIGLAFVPSSLMLGVTTYITTDIASMPLLWVIPLALYLGTFIIAFGKVPEEFQYWLSFITPALLLAMTLITASQWKPSSYNLTLGLHLLTFTAVALSLHGELARTRPATSKLTEFFLLISVGGVLGGLFNAMIAPLVFNFIAEYPIAIILGCAFLPSFSRKPNTQNTYFVDAAAIIGIFLLCLTLVWLTQNTLANVLSSLARSLGTRYANLAAIVGYGIPLGLCYLFIDRPFPRFGLAVASIFLVGAINEDNSTKLLQERSYFGVLRLDETRDYQYYYYNGDPEVDRNTPRYEQYPIVIGGGRREQKYFATVQITGHKLVHGTTLHGVQRLGLLGPGVPSKDYFEDEPVRGLHGYARQFHKLGYGYTLAPQTTLDAIATAATAWEFWQDPGSVATSYYHRTGPLGRIFNGFGAEQPKRVALIGMGSGTSSIYGNPGQTVVFYEIDSHVPRISGNSKYFTYMTSCIERGCDLRVVMGDARIQLRLGAEALVNKAVIERPEENDRLEQMVLVPDGRLGFDKFNLIAVDAFSSDAIPVHLLTKEALQLYIDRLEPGGVFALHISNRYLALDRVVAGVSESLNLEARIMNDSTDEFYQKSASSWCVLTRREDRDSPLWKAITELNDMLKRDNEQLFRPTPSIWKRLGGEGKRDRRAIVWTDDFSNIIDIYNRGRE